MADIVIIGGGVIGASIAFHLGALGAKEVVLLERGAIGRGETHKSGGFVQTHWDLLAEVRLIARSREMFANWKDIVGGECGFVRGGYLHVTGTDREPDVRRVHDMLIADGLESHWIDHDDLLSIQPLLNLDRLIGGAWEPASGWCDSLATTKSLAAAAKDRGVDIREGVTATKIEHAGGRVTGVVTTTGTIPCRAVILAAGPRVPALHATPEAALPLEIMRGQVAWMNRPNGLPAREIGFYDEVTGVYTHPSGDLNLMGCDRHHPFSLVENPDDYNQDIDGKWLVKAAMAMGYRLPALREVAIQRGVTGLYDFTPDGQPILDGPIGGLEGYYLACGFSGVGFKSAPATGLGMAELVVRGAATSVDIGHLLLSRFAPVAATVAPS
ncbi:MAG: NAD(P)/FAD-dependent oxidoreductase [Kofleriaceae bacterium]